MTGNVIVARFDPRRACIEGYRLVAEHGKHTFESWSWNEDVIIHTFNPLVQLWLDDPVIKLDPQAIQMLMTCEWKGRCRQDRSAPSQRFLSAKLFQTILPAKHRVRRESSSKFYEVGHKPRTLEEASDQTFRLRKWLDFGGMEAQLGVRIGDNIMTFSTLLQESYTPTKDKPWQGLWVGDYSGHGCEFCTWRSPEGSDDFPDQHFDTDTAETQQMDEALSSSEQAIGQPPVIDTPAELLEFGDDPSCKGRLEAIKLTGDPNVPKGEYTWIAEDIGPKGFIRVATEQMFKGARVVRSLGHCANRGFRNDRYVVSQLIMISHDTLAQYWEEFGHVSFYKRIDLADYLNV
ncbi:alpha-glucosidase [Physcia stellaris]|nr:alpha-glucosidase [Physcia stellaris]